LKYKIRYTKFGFYMRVPFISLWWH